MFVLSTIVAAIPACLACVPPDAPDPPRHDLLSGTPVGPDGRAHLLTADAECVCWWSVDEDGESEIHRVWPLPGPHGVGLVVLEDGTVLVAMAARASWGILRVDPTGEERAWSVPGQGALTAFRAEGRTVVLSFAGPGEEGSTVVQVDTGEILASPSDPGRPDAPQSRR